MRKNYDFLIIGQGLAGSLLAWHLLEAGQRVLVIDDNQHTAASKIAAGMINPLAGMRFNCHPDTALWLDAAIKFYQSLGRVFQRIYWHPIKMQRLFRAEEQQRFYHRQAQKNAYADYLGNALEPGDLSAYIQYPHGGFWQYQTGYVDLAVLLLDLQNWLKQRQALQQQSINYAQITLAADQIQYQAIQARQLIFCEGYRMHNNPWFNYLPLQPDKGEILTLESHKPISRYIINGAHWLIPLANGGYRFGATHEHTAIHPKVSEKGRSALQRGLQQLLRPARHIDIQAHVAGIRPGTQDRQPFIGTHPNCRQVHLFNGFGARGALTIPWYARLFTQHLLNNTALPAEINIDRYQ